MTTRQSKRAHPFGTSFVLDETREFIGSIVWAPGYVLDLMTLAVTLTHVLGNPKGRAVLTAVPHIMGYSKDWGVGKSTLFSQVPMLLADHPWQVGRGTTEPSINSKFLAGPVNALVVDDMGKVFGENGLSGKLTKLYDLLVKSYTSDGVISVSANRVAKDLPVFCMAFMNGLEKSAPDDLLSRAIVIEMKRKPARVRKANALSAGVKADAEALREALHGWAGSQVSFIEDFLLNEVIHLHPSLNDRLLQKWGALFALAHAAGGTWPGRIMTAFMRLALDASEKPPVLPFQQLLLDTAGIIEQYKVPVIFTADLIAELRELPDGDYYNKADNAYLVETLFPKALGPSEDLTGLNLEGEMVSARGRKAGPLLRKAAQLYALINPEPEQHEPNAVQRELEMRKAS